MKALTVISAALVAVASFASAQTTTTVPSYRASCGQNQATFDLCVKNALTDTSLIIYADVPTACIGQTASQLDQFTCQCFWYRKVENCFNLCSADPFAITISSAATSNCDAAAQFSTTRSVATATTTGGSASSPSVAVTTGVVTATTAPAATTKTSAAGLSCTLHSALISVFGAVCVAAAASAL